MAGLLLVPDVGLLLVPDVDNLCKSCVMEEVVQKKKKERRAKYLINMFLKWSFLLISRVGGDPYMESIKPYMESVFMYQILRSESPI